MKSFALIACLTLSILLAPGMGSATELQNSAELRALVKQAETTYLRPMGTDIKTTLNTAPEAFASILGMTLQRQFNYLRHNKQYLRQYQNLESQALTFVHQLARAHNYKSPRDGSSLPEARMGVEFYNGLNGKSNPFFIQNYGIDPATVNLPMMLAQVPVPEADGGSSGRFIKQDEGINLLNEGAPAAESSNYQQPVYQQPTAQYTCAECPKTKQPNIPESRWCGDISVKCYYFKKNGQLSNQYMYKKGEPHGTWLSYKESKQGVYLKSLEDYKNGKHHGRYEYYDVSKNGQPYLQMQREYVEGTHVTSKEFQINPQTGKAYNHKAYQKDLGTGQTMTISYWPNGQTHDTYVRDRNNKVIGRKCLDENGRTTYCMY